MSDYRSNAIIYGQSLVYISLWLGTWSLYDMATRNTKDWVKWTAPAIMVAVSTIILLVLGTYLSP